MIKPKRVLFECTKCDSLFEVDVVEVVDYAYNQWILNLKTDTEIVYCPLCKINEEEKNDV